MSKRNETKRRHYFIVKLARLILRRPISRSYNLKFKVLKEYKNKDPFLILANHVIPLDPIIMGSSFPFHIHYFASEQIFNLGILSKLLVFAVNPIKKKKSMNDISAIRKARKIVQEGKSVGIFPEGNVSYDGESIDIDVGLVKLVRFLKIPVIFFITHGLYFSNPRWSVYRKKGKSKLFIKEIIYPEEYNELTDEELYKRLNEGLYVNAYDQEDVLFKGKKIAEGLQRLLFMDLLTNEPLQTYTKDNMLRSNSSDFELEYLETGYAKDKDGNLKTLIELNKATKESYLKYYKENESFSFETNVLLSKNYKNKKKKLGKHKLTLNKDKLVLIDKKNNQTTFDFENMSGLAIQGKKKIIIYYKDDTWLVEFDITMSPYIYLLTYEFYKQGEKIYDSRIDISKFGL